MILVRIELHSAVTGQASEIGRMVICNDGTGSPKRGNYSVALGRRGITDTRAILAAPQRRGEVKLFPRVSLSVWVLVARALKAIGIERFADFYEKELDAALQKEGL